MSSSVDAGTREESAGQTGFSGLKTGTKYGLFAAGMIGVLLTVAGAQSLAFFARFTPAVNEANERLVDLQIEGARGDLFNDVVKKLNTVKKGMDEKSDTAKLIDTAVEEFKSHFNQTPLDKIKALRARLPALQEALDAGTGPVKDIEDALDRLQAVYSDPYQRLYDELDAPPWYLQPLAPLWITESGYLDAVTYNRAMYLARVGEIGTARVLLTGLYARAEDPGLLALVYYGLGRLQYEQFVSSPKPENYLQAVQYLRQSLQEDPDLSLAKRLFDYLLSLSQKEGVPKSGKGEPTTFTEGNRGAISREKPLF